MKPYKRILSLFLSFAMVICLSVPAFAVGEPTSGFWQWIPGFTPGGVFGDGGSRGDEASTAYKDYTKKVKDKLGTTSVGSKGFYIYAPGFFPLTFGEKDAKYSPGPPTVLTWISYDAASLNSSIYFSSKNSYGDNRPRTTAPVDGYYTYDPTYSFENAAFAYDDNPDLSRRAFSAGQTLFAQSSLSFKAIAPALGHTWVVERTVQTTYDDAGALVQKGYTLYKCSVCGEQYKDENGTGLPPSGGGSGGGGESGGGAPDGFWAAIIDGISNIVGKLIDAAASIVATIFDGIVRILDAATGGIFGKLSDFLFGGEGGQSSTDFYNNPATFSGRSVWVS